MRKYLFVVAAIMLATVMFSCKNEEKKTDPTTPQTEEPQFGEEVYPEVGERNCILLEEFTGQTCPNCPRAIAAIDEVLESMENSSKVAWVAHHSGYNDDRFTQQGDKDLATALFIYYDESDYTYAPAAALDRSQFKADDGTSYVHLADYVADKTLLNKMIAVPAEASIDLKAILLSDSTLKVRVTGKSNQSEAYVTIMLCQNGIVSTQVGADDSKNYTHNDVVRAYLTDAKGDQLTVDGENKYSYTATYKIPASISNYKGKHPFATDIDNMFVVVSVHGAVTKTAKGSIYNTDKLYLSTLK